MPSVKDLGGKLLLVVSVVGLAGLGFNYINPIIRDGYSHEGVCNVTTVSWVASYCYSHGLYYYAPNFMGYFIKNESVVWEQYEQKDALYYTDLYLYYNTAFNTGGTTSYDEFSGRFLYDNADSAGSTFNCSTEDYNSTTLQRAIFSVTTSYLPDFRYDWNGFDLLQTVTYTPSTTFYFSCYNNRYQSGTIVLLFYGYTSKLWLIPFIACIISCIVAVELLRAHGRPDLVKGLADVIHQFLLLIFYLPAYFGTMLVWTIVFWCIGAVICGISESNMLTPEEFWSRGSIFLPFVMLYKCAFKGEPCCVNVSCKCCDRSSQVEDTPAQEPVPPTTRPNVRPSTPDLNGSLFIENASADPDLIISQPAPPYFSVDDTVGDAPPSYADVMRGEEMYK